MKYEKPEMIVDVLGVTGVIFTSLAGSDSSSGESVDGGDNQWPK